MLTVDTYKKEFKGLQFSVNEEHEHNVFNLGDVILQNNAYHVQINWVQNGRPLSTRYPIGDVWKHLTNSTWRFVLNSEQRNFVHELHCKVIRLDEANLINDIINNGYYTLFERKNLQLVISKYYEL